MRILMLGAGAVGGYFGARLVEAGADVTFLVRPARAARIERDGLIVRSPVGDLALRPQMVTEAGPGYDLAVLGCKAYDLAGAADAIAPAVAAGAALMPLLNGVAHIDTLSARFGAGAVIGGTVQIGATLGPAGEILHAHRGHRWAYGELDGRRSERCARFDAIARKARFTAAWSADMRRELWDKFTFLTAMAAGTSTMRGAIGEIAATPEGAAFMIGLIDECVATATAEGYGVDAAEHEGLRRFVTDKRSGLSSSMFRDIERGGDVEADHIVGDMLARARRHGIAAPHLGTALAHLHTYRARRGSKPVESRPPPYFAATSTPAGHDTPVPPRPQ